MLTILFTLPCAVGCGPVYSAWPQVLARDLAQRPLILEFGLKGKELRLEVGGEIVEGRVAEVDVAAIRIGDRWYAREQMQDPGDGNPQNMKTGVGAWTRFRDAASGKLIAHKEINANELRRLKVGDRWIDVVDIRFLETLRFDDPEEWDGQRVSIRTREGRTFDGEITPIDAQSFEMDGTKLSIDELEEFTKLTRCYDCEGSRAFIYTMGGVSVIAVLVAIFAFAH